MTMESLTGLCLAIQSHFHRVIIDKCTGYYEIEDLESQLPNLVDHFQALIKTIGDKPQTTRVDFKNVNSEHSGWVFIENLNVYFGIAGMYGGFKVRFEKTQGQQQISLTKPESPCHCKACLSMKNHHFSGSSRIDSEEFKKWSLVTESWSRLVVLLF